jgi:hypothetical protein
MGFEKLDPPRPLTSSERQLLDALVELREPTVRDLLRTQLDASSVDGEYAEGDPTFTLVVDCGRAERIPDVSRVVVEATGTDVSEGGDVEIILFADDGYISELQCYRMDDTIVRHLPDVRALRPKVWGDFERPRGLAS